jgi:hypothetical protein
MISVFLKGRDQMNKNSKSLRKESISKPTKASVFFSASFLSTLVMFLALSACNDAPKGRPAAGGVLPKPQGDNTKPDPDNITKTKQTEEEEAKKKQDADAKANATQPSGPNGAPVGFAPKVITVAKVVAGTTDETENATTCMFNRGEKITVKTEPVLSTVSNLHHIVEIEPISSCKLTKLSLTKSDWSGW